jgi:phosphoribosylamine--glycine ligase
MRAAARLESSKAFAKRQMERAGVPTASSATFNDPDAALAHLESLDGPPVVKADWLAAGKGVVVPDTIEEAEGAVRDLFGGVAPGARLVLEERLEGMEVSAFAFVSDATVVPLAAARDYKRLGDGDSGPYTGGMGAFAPVPWYGRDALERAAAEIFEPIAWRMARDGTPYRGVLYAGLMLTASGPMVLEFNARFGDPEAQVLLPLLDGELSTALLGCAMGDRSLMEGSVRLADGTAVGVVVASEGYPDAPVTGRVLSGAEPSSPADDGERLCFHAGTRGRTDGTFETTGGRVVTIVGRGPTLADARRAAYRGVEEVQLEGAASRTDVGELHVDDREDLRDEAG